MYFSGGLIPYYILLKELHLLNTFFVYIIPGMINGFFVMTGINFFKLYSRINIGISENGWCVRTSRLVKN